MTQTSDVAVLARVFEVIQSRRGADPKESYVAKLTSKGLRKIAQKVGEEAVETVIAAVGKDRPELVRESADLLFMLMVLWAEMGVTPEDIYAELAEREGTTGLDEKRARRKKSA